MSECMIEKMRIIEQNNRKKNFYLPKICISKYFFVPLHPKYVFFYRSCACERIITSEEKEVVHA